MPPECQLFGTLGCHLCELAEAELMPLVEHGLMVELVDIADSQQLFDSYGLRIPVPVSYTHLTLPTNREV